MTRYLLGELSEAERMALEEKYFADSTLFDQLTRVESDLIDDYARDRLSPSVRQRFEESYLEDPRRHARLKFGEAFITRVDEIELEDSTITTAPQITRRERLFGGFRNRIPVFAWSAAVAAILLLFVGGWFFIQNRRLRQERLDAQAAQEKRERDLQDQIKSEKARNDQLASELDRLRSQPSPVPTPAQQPAPTFASIVLTISGTRGPQAGPPATLVIPAGTEQARFQLNLSDGAYQSYVAVLQTADGRQFFTRSGLKGRTKTHPTLVFVVPANRLSAGDYILTLKGVSSSGESEDVSKSLFRVEKK